MIFKSLVISFVVNLFLTIIKFVYSIVYSSSTLLADSVHCLSDMLTDIVSMIGSKLSEKRPDKIHPFGHGKLEYVTSMILSIFIVGMGISIILGTFEKKANYTSIIPLIIITITIIVKFFLSKYLLKRGKEYKSNILISNGTESRYDTFSSMIAFIFIGISYFGKYNKIFSYADVLGSAVISIFTIKIGIELFIKNVKAVIGEVETDKTLLKDIRKIIVNKELYELKRLTAIKYGTYYEVIVDLKIDKNLKLEELYEIETNLKTKLKEKSYIKYVTINMNPL